MDLHTHRIGVTITGVTLYADGIALERSLKPRSNIRVAHFQRPWTNGCPNNVMELWGEARKRAGYGYDCEVDEEDDKDQTRLFLALAHLFLKSSQSFTKNPDSNDGKLSDFDYITLERASMHNRASLESDQKCGCYYCNRIFHPREIKEWTDQGTTAICPYCGMDSVLRESSKFPITEEYLQKASRRAFASKYKD